jgi:hypothetical protein
MSIKINNLTINSSTLEDLTDLEIDATHGGGLPLLLAPIAVGVGSGAIGGVLGQGLGNFATGKPLSEKVPESAALGAGLGLIGPAGTAVKSLSVVRPLLQGAKTFIPASQVLRPIGQGAAGGLGNSLINK